MSGLADKRLQQVSHRRAPVDEVLRVQALYRERYDGWNVKHFHSHYWHTPVAGGKVDKQNSTQFGRAMTQLGIEMIPAYSPQARGRSERMFATHQDRLVKELAAAGITSMDAAKDYLEAVYRPAHNEELTRPAGESGSAFVPLLDIPLTDILCDQFERTVGQDNCVSFEAMVLQIPQDQHRMHYVKTKVRVHRYHDGSLAVFHGPRKLAEYNRAGKDKNSKTKVAA